MTDIEATIKEVWELEAQRLGLDDSGRVNPQVYFLTSADGIGGGKLMPMPDGMDIDVFSAMIPKGKEQCGPGVDVVVMTSEALMKRVKVDGSTGKPKQKLSGRWPNIVLTDDIAETVNSFTVCWTTVWGELAMETKAILTSETGKRRFDDASLVQQPLVFNRHIDALFKPTSLLH